MSRLFTEKELAKALGIVNQDEVKRANTMRDAINKTFLNGSSYEGQVNSINEAQGFGIIKLTDGSHYEGTWT
jgi:hypothetical protein